MKILVINAGSSSLKFTLFVMPARRTLASGMVERIGESNAALQFRADGFTVSEPCQADDHEGAMRIVMDTLMRRSGVLSGPEEIAAVGHRVVHGGTTSHSMVVDDQVKELIRQNEVLAPLHNPPNLAGLEAAMHMLPQRPQVAVFDTAFHTTMPPRAFLYALPYRLYTEHRVRAYGFHGTSHRYVTDRAAQMLGIPLDRFNAITLHLGNGCSATAVRNGQSVDTSMGLTPLAGLVMGTRCGDMDPALPFLLSEWLGMDMRQVYELCNRQSGLLGLSGISNDMRELEAACQAGNERAEMALDVFAYRVIKYVGAYFAVLGRTDAIVFTAGIGERSPAMRRRICQGLQGLGVLLDEKGNEAAIGTEAVISAAGSAVTALVVPTNEELQIAVETYDLVSREGQP